MKKCPTCQKTFAETMRFCQIDGTPLVDDAPPLDPYKTIVARPIDISESIPAAPVVDEPAPSEPVIETPAPAAPVFEEPAAVEAAANAPAEIAMPPIEEPEDILEVPSADPLKTMYVSDDEMRAAMGSLDQPELPAYESPATEPEPPKFIEHEIPSPVFGDRSPAAPPVAETPAETESPKDVFSVPAPPIASPFDSNPPVSHHPEPEAATIMQEFPPASPFSTPETPFSPTPEPVFTPAPAEPVFKEPEPFQPAAVESYQPASSPAEWTPPPAPDASWQNQPIGQNTPFQPPPAGGGASQTLALISLILGIVGLIAIVPSLLFIFCSILPLGFGIGALITGLLSRSKIKQNPDQYTGSGLAMGGVITGALAVLAPIALIIITVILWLVWGMAMTMPR